MAGKPGMHKRRQGQEPDARKVCATCYSAQPVTARGMFQGRYRCLFMPTPVMKDPDGWCRQWEPMEEAGAAAQKPAERDEGQSGYAAS